MMTIQALGLLGLLGIGILVLIYVLKPNYQQKIISSTFVWKLSLKYKKRQIPVSRLRNILIVVCQVLIITMSAFILARPLIIEPDSTAPVERIIILDASANMRAITDGKTRFERALEDITVLGNETIENGGKISVIYAGEKPDYITSGTDTKEQFEADMAKYSGSDCTFMQGDVDGAIAMAQIIKEQSHDAEVSFYTATRYARVRNMEIVSYADDEAWNAAILDVAVEIIENFYVFTVEVASYNSQQTAMPIVIKIEGARTPDSEQPIVIEFETEAKCLDNQPTKVVIDSYSVYAYETFSAEIQLSDSFSRDNSFVLYGGTKEDIRIQYSSPVPNTFFRAVTQGYRNSFSDRWNVSTVEITKGGLDQNEQMSGFDFYIFEHEMPEEDLPTDGVVMLVNPDRIPKAVAQELELNDEFYSGNFTLSQGAVHPIMTGLSPNRIEMTKYKSIVWHDSKFTPLLYCGDSPILLIKETEDVKMVILTIDVRFSQISMLPEFPTIMRRIFDYFMPATLNKHVFDVGEDVIINTRGTQVIVNIDGESEQFETFPRTISINTPGSYEVIQTLLSTETTVDNFFVKISREQSNYARIVDEINGPYVPAELLFSDIDLIIYLAAVLVLLLFVEWYLQTREQS